MSVVYYVGNRAWRFTVYKVTYLHSCFIAWRTLNA